MASRSLAFVNFKGGVGKTSLSVNIAACLAHDLNKRVLLVDCDPQSNSSIWLMDIGRWSRLKRDSTLLALFEPNQPPLQSLPQKGVVQDSDERVIIHRLDLIPSTYDLMELEHGESSTKKTPHMVFFEAMAYFKTQYDFIIFDCPPGLTSVCKAAIFASDEIYVPCNPDELSRIGLDFLDKKLTEFKDSLQSEMNMIPGYRFPRVRGVIYNSVNGRAKNETVPVIDSKVADLRLHSPIFDRNSKIFTIQISQTVNLPRAVAAYKPVTIVGKGKEQDEYLTISQYILSPKVSRRGLA